MSRLIPRDYRGDVDWAAVLVGYGIAPPIIVVLWVAAIHLLTNGLGS